MLQVRAPRHKSSDYEHHHLLKAVLSKLAAPQRFSQRQHPRLDLIEVCLKLNQAADEPPSAIGVLS
jgi:hypothetical protein